jgi:uncharacterized membrane protein YraQ (UPF0718 family)
VNTLLLILQKAATTTWDLALYVIVGVLLGEALRYTPAAALLERICRKTPTVSVVASAFLGMASPLCTYGTIPVVLELLRAGVPVAPLATFLATSSLMNPQLLMITWGGLGPKMALARVSAVLLFGLLLGALLYVLPQSWSVLPALDKQKSAAPRRKRAFTIKDFMRRSWRTLEFVGFYVLVGVVLGAAVEVLVPGRWIFALFGSGGWLQILLASLLGVPLYACGGGTIPLVQALLEQGMAPGAALAFLVAGPATRITPLMALATIMRPAFVAAYITLLVLYSVATGIFYGFV